MNFDPATTIRINSERTATAAAACEDVTRLVIVKNGAYTEHWADSWRVSVQDAGRTIKFFATGDGGSAIEERSAELGAMFGISASEAATFAQTVAENQGQPERFARNPVAAPPDGDESEKG